MSTIQERAKQEQEILDWSNQKFSTYKNVNLKDIKNLIIGSLDNYFTYGGMKEFLRRFIPHAEKDPELLRTLRSSPDRILYTYSHFEGQDLKEIRFPSLN
jgi:hypothetical protein